MPWRNGRYVSRATSDNRDRPLRASKLGRFKFKLDGDFSEEDADAGVFTEALVKHIFGAGSFTNDVLRSLVKSGAFVADTATRNMFANGFVDSVLLGAKTVLKTHLSGGFVGKAVISGGGAGDHTVTGIALGDQLIYVYEQNGTSGIITDLTSEFSIIKSDTINNTGGTGTASDKLLVLYLDLT